MTDLDPLLKRLHLANARRVWRDLVQRAEKEQWTYEALLLTLFSEEVAHRRGTRLGRAVRSAPRSVQTAAGVARGERLAARPAPRDRHAA